MHKKNSIIKYVLLLLLFLGSYIFINSFSKTLLDIPSSTGESSFIYSQDILGFKIVDLKTNKTFRRFYQPFFMDYQKFYLLGINGYPDYLKYFEDYNKYKNMDYVFFERRYRSGTYSSPHLGPMYFENLNKMVNVYHLQYESSNMGRDIYKIAIYDQKKQNDRLNYIDIHKEESCIRPPHIYYTDEQHKSFILFLCDLEANRSELKESDDPWYLLLSGYGYISHNVYTYTIPHVYDVKREEFIEITNEIASMNFKEYNLSYFPDMTNNRSDTKRFDHGEVTITQEIDFHGTGPFGGVAWHKSNIQVSVGDKKLFEKKQKNDALYQYLYNPHKRMLHIITMLGKSYSVKIPQNVVFEDIYNGDIVAVDPPNLTLLAFLCGKSNGRWERDNCNMPTSDGGNPCSDSDECENSCIAELSNEEWESIDEDGLAVTKIGTCSRWKNNSKHLRTPYVKNGQVDEHTIY